MALLAAIHFDEDQDTLCFVGDLINRGPKPLEVLRFIKSLKSASVVLGNHDLFLLASAYSIVQSAPASMQTILDAPDRIDIVEWLRHLPVFHRIHDGYLVHAGVPPQWSLADCQLQADQVQAWLRGKACESFLRALEIPGNQTNRQEADRSPLDAAVYATNVFTRMRLVDQDGNLDFQNKTIIADSTDRYRPWFHWYNGSMPVYFGHWATLHRTNPALNVYALDSGCVYGLALTAVRVEDKQFFKVDGYHS